jgi:hypothetical protein
MKKQQERKKKSKEEKEKLRAQTPMASGNFQQLFLSALHLSFFPIDLKTQS